MQDKVDEELKNKPADKAKGKAWQKIGGVKIDEKYRKQAETKNAEKSEKEETGTPVGFEKFGGRRHAAKTTANKDKEPQSEKQAENTEHAQKEEQKSFKHQQPEIEQKR